MTAKVEMRCKIVQDHSLRVPLKIVLCELIYVKGVYLVLYLALGMQKLGYAILEVKTAYPQAQMSEYG